MKTDIYSAEAKKVSTIELPENVFGKEFNNDLVHQVMVSMNSNKRANIAHTKDRSEVRGGGKKP
jgi:large subunit ribosomal protein L4